MTEVNAVQLAQKSSAPYTDVVREHLEAWVQLGYNLHTCSWDQDLPCMDQGTTTVDAVVASGPQTFLQLVVQRPVAA